MTANTETHDITVYQGKTYVEQFTVLVLTNPLLPWNATTNRYIALDITNYDVRMQVRPSFDSAVIKLTALSTLTSPKFIKNNTGGIITLTLLPADTSAIAFAGEEANYYYDIELAHQSLSTVLLLSFGSFNIKREITR